VSVFHGVHGVTSAYFIAVNGVEQGAVLSIVFFCLHIDDLLLNLSRSAFACYVGTQQTILQERLHTQMILVT